MRAVNLQNFEAGGVGAGGGLAPMGHDVGDFRAAEGARGRHAFAVRDGTRGHQFPAFPVEHFGVIGGLRLLALPRAGQAGLAAGVTDLDRRHRALRLDEIGHSLEAGHELVVPQAEVADRAAAPPLDFG